MMSTEPEISPNLQETMPKPSETSTSTAWGFQPPPSYTSLGYQAQSGLPPPIISPGIFASNQLDQGNIQILNSNPAMPATKFTEEAKSLGAIQIIIGLMHMSFGVVLGLVCFTYRDVFGFTSIAFLSGYPFWGGLFFIITGALTICASKDLSSCLVKSSLGMNIFSAILSFTGVILLLVDESINGYFSQDYWAVLSGKGISAVLIIFSLLDFCVAFTTAYLANQAAANIQRVSRASPLSNNL
ncbi:membrane-spanning 4-domains subfamily A member 12-like [Erinaceus europaeus]|uniref:Membrane-spanning 4-domains subfamily A member 12-like n=1 Tax=Erinaceus europaeus TaxID=9365 RepID=A0A1S3W7Y4_ERIEU|nr:membrane-spanning 4-domains subfamily A member 12-like [Erinaceus europaeus]